MPLGFFGGTQGKPQPLSSCDGGKEKKEKKDSSEKDCRGSVLKLSKTTVTIEKKLAEGGFAIVYLVTDKKNRQYALKRQFIRDDPKQIEACKREYQIVSSLRDHKNIVCYVDHFMGQNKAGICDYMLLTSYYKVNLLQWINDRLSTGRGLTPSEVIAIFCDMCEAVARLHHSQTPVIHRDLKVENILIDERNRAAPPIYVLCDFGSATTKVLSSHTHPINFIQEEIEKYTTLSYRAPEMIDIYEGKPIGTKVDSWAMGIMFYKLCYFSLPFGESALAIQNGSFSFPTSPVYPESIRAIIRLLLDSDIDRRPSIYEISSLAFEVTGKECPVNNVFNITPRRLSSMVEAFREGKTLDQLDASSAQPIGVSHKNAGEVATAALCSTSPPQRLETTTTSVNPRLRPKPTASIPVVPTIPPSPLTVARSAHHECSSNPDVSRNEEGEGKGPLTDRPVAAGGPLSCPLVMPQQLGFTDLEDSMPRRRAQTDASVVGSSSNKGVSEHVEPGAPAVYGGPDPIASSSASNHRRNASDTSQIQKSAFKPYSQTAVQPVAVSLGSVCDPQTTRMSEKDGNEPDSWNPFLAAPFDTSQQMNDSHFGHEFDELPRNKDVNGRRSDSDAASIDSLDPFGAAPFELPHREQHPVVEEPSKNETDKDSVGSAEDLKRIMQTEEDSELDEQRMQSRRRYSYEHIDGVGEDGSSDSRGARTEGDESTDDHSKNGEDESSFDEENDSSQQTDVASDDGGGRPLLEDDGLEEDEDTPISPPHHTTHIRHNVWEFDHHKHVREPLSIVDPQRNTNPFLNEDCTPKISPAQHVISIQEHNPFLRCDSVSCEPVVDKLVDVDDVIEERPSLPNAAPFFDSYAPATLPRQSTPLAATPKPPQSHAHRNKVAPFVVDTSANRVEVPTVNTVPVTTSLQMATASLDPVTSVAVHSGQQLRTSHENSSHLEMKKSVSPSAKMISLSFVEGPKTPKFREKEKRAKDKDRKKFDLRSSASEYETDGSEAEMCSSISSDKASISKKKKKSASFAYRGSNPMLSQDVLSKKSNEKRKVSSSSVKRGSAGAVNASFVNSSFQSEDLDSPPTQRSARI